MSLCCGLERKGLAITLNKGIIGLEDAGGF